MDISRIHDMKEILTEWAKEELCKGKQCVCTKEMGEVIDMIKDLAEAEKCCYEAKQFKYIVKAMEEEQEKEKKCETDGMPWYISLFSDRAGYDNWRYSSGRFAPKGRGHFAGYMEPWYDPMMHGDQKDWDGYGRMGYDENNKTGGQMRISGMNNGRTGYTMTPYDRYQDARRHYTETHSQEDKQQMDEHAKEHLDASITSFKDIWKDADPEMKRRMKANLSSLVNETNT